MSINSHCPYKRSDSCIKGTVEYSYFEIGFATSTLFHIFVLSGLFLKNEDFVPGNELT